MGAENMKIKVKSNDAKDEEKYDLESLDYINIPPTTGDVSDFKPFNHEFKYASFLPTPYKEVSKSPQPYFDEDDEATYRFFGSEDVESEEDGVAEESLPKINYANKKNRLTKLKYFFNRI
tara:strand:+ start:95 stop:454 length:360 start_codon:yes stop_codon:yes gene_type:complete